MKLGAEVFTKTYHAREKLTPFGKFRTVKTSVINDYGGFRSEYVDADGFYDPDAYCTLLRSNLAVDLRDSDNVRRNATHINSSEAGMLFNMLRQFYLLKIGEIGDLALGDFYNDGHVAASFKEVFGSEGESKLTPIPCNFESSEHPYENDFRWDGWTTSDTEVIAASLCELKGTGPCSLAASSPRLTEMANFTRYMDSYPAWEDSKKIAATITKIVEKFRLYNSFETATYLVAQMACNFFSPTAEAVMLRASEREMIIPEFSSMRFALPGVNSGNMGAVRPASLANYKCWVCSPDTMWTFSAVMNAAAEFRAVKSHGTDFDITGELTNYMNDRSLTSGVGKWATFASSALGKKVHIAEGFILGADPEEAKLEQIKFRQVGDVTHYNSFVDADCPPGYVKLQELMDTQRQPYLSKLLFACDVLPESKVGGISKKSVFRVEHSSHSNSIGMVRHADLGAYMTMTRIFGYDVAVRTAGGRLVKNWADNGSRLPWSPGELSLSSDSFAHIMNLELRGNRAMQDFSPIGKMSYDFELRCRGISLEYEYRNVTKFGRFPMTFELTEDAPTIKQSARIVREVQAPQIISKVMDFRIVPVPRETPHPGESEGLMIPQDIQLSTPVPALGLDGELDLDVEE